MLTVHHDQSLQLSMLIGCYGQTPSPHYHFRELLVGAAYILVDTTLKCDMYISDIDPSTFSLGTSLMYHT